MLAGEVRQSRLVAKQHTMPRLIGDATATSISSTTEERIHETQDHDFDGRRRRLRPGRQLHDEPAPGGARQQRSGGGARKVLIAIKKVPAFEPIKKPEDFFIEKEVPDGTYPAKCLKTFDDIRNQRLAKSKTEEETVFKEDLLTKGQDGIMANLNDGQRAMAIRVNPEALVGGFVLPGSRVDLIGTLASNTGELTAETIMQNMLVLAVDMQTDSADKKSMLGSTVTFAVTPEEAERLSVATRGDGHSPRAADLFGPRKEPPARCAPRRLAQASDPAGTPVGQHGRRCGSWYAQ